MEQTPSLTPLQSLAFIISAVRGLMGGVHVRGGMETAVLYLVWGRMGRMVGALERLMGRFRAGTLVVRGRREIVAAAADAPVTRVRVEGAVWPRRSAWLVRLVGYPAAGHGSQFAAFLQTDEMKALLLAAPQAARILRPMCRMLGVETSLLDPHLPLPVFVPAAVRPPVVRVRAKRAPIDWGNIPLPRGILSHARRLGFKPVR